MVIFNIKDEQPDLYLQYTGHPFPTKYENIKTKTYFITETH